MATKKKSTKKAAKKGSKKGAKKGAKKAAKKAAATGASNGFSELIGRALTDREFRGALYSRRESALKGYNLTKADRAALEQLPREELENQAKLLGNRSALTIKVVIRVRF
jgi:hypothetical protein